ncbi:MAG: serine/threonine protein phosphatase [Thermodesulfobacterium geofontis]|uniref:Serine/threonine protein phosphatase n=2 Tax=Thermodesulfobacterium geofontis TaxID=1295609 RepID=A0A2N7PPD8_9BACT|nr:MAG: serine/threonine protein phosphatase [Thermodesulfobacterium geofontis]
MTEEHAFGTTGKCRIFAIGDIHGCLWSLEKLLNILPANWGSDLIIFLGDYIDRGPDPKGVIERVLELKELYGEKIITLKGNHEWMFERFLKGIDIDIFLYNGGGTTLKSYYKNGKLIIPEDHLEFLRGLKLYYETEEYIFVHAGLRPGKKLEEQVEEDLLWIRDSFYFSEYKFPKTVVFGHTPFPIPLVLEDRIGIDTGCVYGGKLTAIELPSKKIYQIDCGGEIV